MRPSREERRRYWAAEGRVRESIELRPWLSGHTYPKHAEDLATMRDFHGRYGIPSAGIFERLRRLLGS